MKKASKSITGSTVARASRIYLVHHKGFRDPVLAAFTVKYESQRWAEQSEYDIENLERTSMKDGGDSNSCGTRVVVPWV